MVGSSYDPSVTVLGASWRLVCVSDRDEHAWRDSEPDKEVQKPVFRLIYTPLPALEAPTAIHAAGQEAP